MLQACSIPRGGSGNSWDVMMDATDLAAEPAHDFKGSGATSIDGVTVQLDDAAGCSRAELDGSTGLVLETDAAEFGWLYNYTPASYFSAGRVRFDLADAIAGWDSRADLVAVQWYWASLAGISAAEEGVAGILMEQPTPAADFEFIRAQIRRVGANDNFNVSLKNAGLSTGNALLDFWEMIIPPFGNGAVIRAGAWPGSWKLPGSWTPTETGMTNPNNVSQATPAAGASWFASDATACFAFAATDRYGTGGGVQATLGGFRVLRAPKN